MNSKGVSAQIGLKHEALTEKIIGIFYDVYNELGHGFLEAVYRNSMAIAFSECGLKSEQEVPVPVWFRGERIGLYRADLIVEHLVLVELKSARTLESCHEAQLLHYLRATEVEIGLLLNFGLRPQFRRLVFDNERKKLRESPRVSEQLATDLRG
jgi:GxxExxY protein